MELVSILRLLWSRPILLGAGVLVALAVGMLAANGALPGPAQVAGDGPRTASVRVLVDTTSSQLVNADPPAADTVAARAVLLAGLMASDEARAKIARRVGVMPDRLAVIGPSVTVPTVPTKLSERTTTAIEAAPEPYAVTLNADGALPIVAIDVRAPDAAGVRRLAHAATTTLASLTAPPDRKTKRGVVSTKRGFVTQALGRPLLAPPDSGPGPAVFAIAAFLVTFATWCGCIVLASGLTPGPRSQARVA
jgi:hypothetical protein